MRVIRAIIGAFAFVTALLSCEQNEKRASFESTAGGSEAVEQSIPTCIRSIGVELMPDSIIGPDALVVSFTSTDKIGSQMVEQDNDVTLIVWKDTSTTIEDSAVYTSSNARVRKKKNNEYIVYYPGMGFRDFKTNKLLVISNEELRKNPQIRIKAKGGREWTFRYCQ